MRVVMVNGCFDTLHYGHVLHLEAAGKLGNRLVVALTSDRYVREQKGPGRPVFTQYERAHMLRALRCVDEVIISDEPTPASVILKVMPNVYVKGIDYKGKRIAETALVESLGGRVVFTETPKWSSTAIIKRLRRAA